MSAAAAAALTPAAAVAALTPAAAVAALTPAACPVATTRQLSAAPHRSALRITSSTSSTNLQSIWSPELISNLPQIFSYLSGILK